MPKNKVLYLIIGLAVVAVAGVAVSLNGEMFQGYFRFAGVRPSVSTERRASTAVRRTTIPKFTVSRVSLDNTIERDGLIDAAALKIDTASSISGIRFQTDASGIKIRRFSVFLDNTDVTLKLNDASRQLLEQGLDLGNQSFQIDFAEPLAVSANATLKIRAEVADVGNDAGESLSVKILDMTTLDSTGLKIRDIGAIEYHFNIESVIIDAPETIESVIIDAPAGGTR